ncbi:hypothetical protein L226DRAFT_576349 [Lentinus tigrinus ALCF2SS1-7]|uniref:Uncharacterized protein n=1 Tax=Lentinus tigrinus ALCF2SS1-6 TaxID=1328759 RepID=A0A5C2RXF3_9APHY|nr:hypothetical protein L227DRAFT_615123 [Lentinus tigrinus ALCF2SS1-6]RPD68556.1 hypothetical protein L226DRAFT_576349 [Lentinus tigrinus ALCF2SS1-7]
MPNIPSSQESATADGLAEPDVSPSGTPSPPHFAFPLLTDAMTQSLLKTYGNSATPAMILGDDSPRRREPMEAPHTPVRHPAAKPHAPWSPGPSLPSSYGYASSPVFVTGSPQSPTTSVATQGASSLSNVPPESRLSRAASPAPTLGALLDRLQVSPSKLEISGEFASPVLVGQDEDGLDVFLPAKEVPAARPTVAGQAAPAVLTVPLSVLAPPHWGAYNHLLTVRGSQLFYVPKDHRED